MMLIRVYIKYTIHFYNNLIHSRSFFTVYANTRTFNSFTSIVHAHNIMPLCCGELLVNAGQRICRTIVEHTPANDCILWRWERPSTVHTGDRRLFACTLRPFKANARRIASQLGTARSMRVHDCRRRKRMQQCRNVFGHEAFEYESFVGLTKRPYHNRTMTDGGERKTQNNKIWWDKRERMHCVFVVNVRPHVTLCMHVECWMRHTNEYFIWVERKRIYPAIHCNISMVDDFTVHTIHS